MYLGLDITHFGDQLRGATFPMRDTCNSRHLFTAKLSLSLEPSASTYVALRARPCAPIRYIRKASLLRRNVAWRWCTCFLVFAVLFYYLPVLGRVIEQRRSVCKLDTRNRCCSAKTKSRPCSRLNTRLPVSSACASSPSRCAARSDAPMRTSKPFQCGAQCSMAIFTFDYNTP